MNTIIKKHKNLFYINYKNLAIKHLKSQTILENGIHLSTLGNEKVDIKSPLDSIMAVAGTCEIHTIQYYAKVNNVNIPKIDIDVKGDYDMDIFMDKKQGSNTFSNIDINVKVYSSETDKNKLKQVVEKGMSKCPVVSTLKLAGAKITENVEYL